MSSTPYPRRRPQRRSKIPRGPEHTKGLQQVRDVLPPALGARTIPPTPNPVPSRAGDDAVPPELPALVAHHCRHITTYLARAQSHGHLHHGSMGEWQRLVLYALTDALAQTHLLVGTLAAHLERQGLDPDLLRRYLQSPDPDRYITAHAVEHLDGLTGAVPEEPAEPVWTAIGRQIAARST
ncbi:hypothetical protein [Streptomyces tirandamycinicus]|uniref:Uncharacterized protein n=1 Tax=Streptomyces tirandamycinicus TaxID=2174846 RepID=A0A2S1SLS6_9ACTN|nr:hypothetical protein [Streptomyces tirandamycinicus]AWI27348.1 hypothetical protein DDW44_00055 [Streptomyces tirandamycinicus]